MVAGTGFLNYSLGDLVVEYAIFMVEVEEFLLIGFNVSSLFGFLGNPLAFPFWLSCIYFCPYKEKNYIYFNLSF